MTQQTIAEAQRAIDQGRVDEAERLLRGAVQTDPESVDVHMALAAVHTRKEDHAAAAESFAKAMRIDRARKGLALSYAVSCFKAGRYSEAEQSAALAVKNEQSAGAYDALACALREQGKTTEALAAAENAARLDPASNAAQHTRGSVLLAMGRSADALAIFETLNARGVSAPAITLNRGEALEKLGRAQEAQRLYADAALAWPNFAQLQRERAQRRH